MYNASECIVQAVDAAYAWMIACGKRESQFITNKAVCASIRIKSGQHRLFRPTLSSFSMPYAFMKASTESIKSYAL